jgi:hypothetical protein
VIINKYVLFNVHSTKDIMLPAKNHRVARGEKRDSERCESSSDSLVIATAMERFESVPHNPKFCLRMPSIQTSTHRSVDLISNMRYLVEDDVLVCLDLCR